MVFSLTPFKYLFHFPKRPLVIFNYEIRELAFYYFIAKMLTVARILIGFIRVLKAKRKKLTFPPRLEKQQHQQI